MWWKLEREVACMVELAFTLQNICILLIADSMIFFLHDGFQYNQRHNGHQ
jgi:hypothetical protein